MKSVDDELAEQKFLGYRSDQHHANKALPRCDRSDRRADLVAYFNSRNKINKIDGKGIELYKGVETWFDRINEYGKTLGYEIEHYIISSGLKEIIEGSSIKKHLAFALFTAE